MRGGGGREKDATGNNSEQESWQWDTLREGVFTLNFTRPSPKRDSSLGGALAKTCTSFPAMLNSLSLYLLQVTGWVSTHRRGQRRAEQQTWPGFSSRVDYLEHPVVPRLLGFQISHHGNGNASLEGTEPPSVLTVSRAWLSSVGRPSSSQG